MTAATPSRIQTVSLAILFLFFSSSLYGADFYVKNGTKNGDGTISNPFNTLQIALNTAEAGDFILVFDGSYTLSAPLTITNSGTGEAPITLKALNGDVRPVIKRSGKIFDIKKPNFILDGFILDGGFGTETIVSIENASSVIIRNCEIKNSRNSGIFLDRSDHVVIQNCHIHHLLGGSFLSPEEANGIVATSQRNLIITGCDIHHVSGNCFKANLRLSESIPESVVIEDSRLWTGPLQSAAGDWKKGEIPGKTAIDSNLKPTVSKTGTGAKMVIINADVFGFTKSDTFERVAFNFEEHLQCAVINSRVFNNHMAFRLSGSKVSLINDVIANNDIAVHLESVNEKLRIFNSTFDQKENGTYFRRVKSNYLPKGLELKNNLFLKKLPNEAVDSSNQLANSAFFVDSTGGNYHLSKNSPVIDSGVEISQVRAVGGDIIGSLRDALIDKGAYEYKGPRTTPKVFFAPSPQMIDITFPNAEFTITLSGGKDDFYAWNLTDIPPWLKLSPSKGAFSPGARVVLSGKIDWKQFMIREKKEDHIIFEAKASPHENVFKKVVSISALKAVYTNPLIERELYGDYYSLLDIR